jgi:hypothetical protein
MSFGAMLSILQPTELDRNEQSFSSLSWGHTEELGESILVPSTDDIMALNLE